MERTLAGDHGQDGVNDEDDYVEALVPEAFAGEVEALEEFPFHRVDLEVDRGVGVEAQVRPFGVADPEPSVAYHDPAFPVEQDHYQAEEDHAERNEGQENHLEYLHRRHQQEASQGQDAFGRVEDQVGPNVREAEDHQTFASCQTAFDRKDSHQRFEDQ